MPRIDVQSPGLTETLVASAARTTSSDSGVQTGWGSASKLRLQLDVSAVSGTTPTLDVVVEDTLDGSTWNVVGTFVQRTAAAREVIAVTALFTDRLRVRWTVGGAVPSFTFSVAVYSE